jgi:hypothetical protein
MAIALFPCASGMHVRLIGRRAVSCQLQKRKSCGTCQAPIIRSLKPIIWMSAFLAFDIYATKRNNEMVWSLLYIRLESILSPEKVVLTSLSIEKNTSSTHITLSGNTQHIVWTIRNHKVVLLENDDM